MKKIFLLNIFTLILAIVQLSAQCTIQVVTTDITQETCVGSSDAMVTATAGGVAPISYLWSDGQTTAIATDLTTGTYTVTATDGAGCTGTAEVEITLDPEGIWLMFTFTPVTCNGGSDGTAHVSVMTGVAPYTYIWNDPAGTTNADPVNLAAGQYTVTVTDVNGCSNYGPVTITEPTAIVVVSNTTNETCAGAADGSATVSASGGTPGYTYLWSDGQTTATANNLTAGSYSVTVTDANDCTSTATMMVGADNPNITISNTVTPVSCFGGSDGSIIINVTTGNGPFTYLWSNGETGTTITTLTAGDYTVTVAGDAGCTAESTISVSEPTELTGNVTGTNVTIIGGNDGTATVTASGGTPSYTYLWSDGQTTATATNLVAGNYSVTITDANGCTATASITIEDPCPTIIATTSHSNETCVGSMDGHVAVSTSGGAGLMTFLWSNGATTDVVNNLSVGTYTVTVTDENGCTATGSETIELSPEGIWVDINITNTCFGGSNGAASAVVTTGVAPYTYAWSNGATTADIINLSAGDYTVTVTDVNGCEGIFTGTVGEEVQIVLTTSHSNETCVGSMDGHVAVSTSGGAGQMSFLWSSGDTTDVVNNLSVGTYTVTVTDENGCTATGSETIELSPEGIWVDINVTDVSCYNGNDGVAASVVTTGVAPYTYAWSNGGSTPTISNLTAGTYTVTVTDVNGCEGIFSATVNQPSELIATATSTNTTCNLPTGTATVSATGGTPAYTYLWSNNETTQTISNLSVGTYTATVTDANGCTAVSSTTITNVDLVIITTVSAIDPSTPTASDGSIDIEVSGGSSYTYLWSNGATTQDISGLSAGCYTVTVTESGSGTCAAITTICIGCILDLTVTTTDNDCINTNIGTATATVTSTCSNTGYTYNWTTSTGIFAGSTQTISGLEDDTYFVTVTDSNGLTVTGSGVVTGSGGITSSATGTDVLCNGDSTGTATGNGFGGSSTYTYLWSNNETTQTISGLPAGTYTVTVTDAVTSCTSVSEVTISEPPVITLSATVTNTNPTDGVIDLTVTGGTPDYTYLWSNGATTEDISGLSVGCYTVTVTDMNNCTASAEFCVPPPPLCSLSLTSTPETCNPGNDGTAMASVIGCTPPFAYVWENNAGDVIGNTAMIMNLTAGMYYVTVTDANLIANSDSIEVTFVGGPDVNTDSEKVTCNGFMDGEVSATPSGGTDPYSYNWEDAMGTSIGNTATVTNLPAGTYSVTVTDAVGCTTVDIAVIDEDDPITLTQITTPLNCFGDTDASISVTASGGVSPYTYMWSIPAGDVDMISALGAGVYTVTVTDANLCTKVDSFTISEPPAITIATDPDTSICENFLVVNATATAGASISWFNQNMLPIGTGSPFAYLNIPSGTNKIYAVTELNGCSAIDSMIIEQNAVSVTVDGAALCQGDVAQLSATNNIADHTIDYEWTPASLFTAGANTATPTFNTAVTGVYEVYLSSTNQHQCVQLDTVTVTVQDTTNNFIVTQQCVGLEVTYTSGTGTEMIWDFGDGSAQVTAISTTHTYTTANDYMVMMILPPGTNNAACLPDTVTQMVPVMDDPIFDTGFILEYDPCVEDSTTVVFTDTSSNVFGTIDSVWWVWQGDTISTNTQDSMVITGSVMDSLTLIVMSEDGCIDSIAQEIDINNIMVNLADTIVACIGVDTFLNPFGNAAYEYTWSPAPNGDPNEINPMITATVSTSYAVTITDNTSGTPCSIEKEVYVLVPEQISDLETSPDTVLCEQGVVTLSASSALADNYNWYDEYPTSPLELGSPTLELVLEDETDAPQYYYVEALDQYGCPTIDSIFAGYAEIITNLEDVTACINEETSIIGDATSNGEMLMYEWLDPNGMVIGMDSVLTLIPTINGTYTINVSNEYGCELMDEFNINIIDVASNIQATADPDTIILGETVVLDVELESTEGNYTYEWTPTGTILGDPNQQSVEAQPQATTDYQVVVTDSTDAYVCSATSNVLVTVLDICERPYVFFPNVFSPNGDDVNDVLKVESVVIDEVYFVIYNRWGEKVFEGNTVDAAWDGTHNGEPVCTDVYGFYLRARCVNGKVYEEKGNVTVLR